MKSGKIKHFKLSYDVFRTNVPKFNHFVQCFSLSGFTFIEIDV